VQQGKNVHTFTLRTINILMLKKDNYKMLIRRKGLAPDMSMSPQTALATEMHLAEGPFLLEEQTFNNAKS
jgi:hypothetical protein